MMHHSGPLALHVAELLVGYTGDFEDILEPSLEENVLIGYRVRQLDHLLENREAGAELYNDIQEGGRTIDRIMARVIASNV